MMRKPPGDSLFYDIRRLTAASKHTITKAHLHLHNDHDDLHDDNVHDGLHDDDDEDLHDDNDEDNDDNVT